MKIAFGSKVKDTITGFVGVVTGYCSYITGCDQYLVQPPVKDTGEHVEARWIDVDRLHVLKTGAVKLASHTTNGPDIAAPVK